MSHNKKRYVLYTAGNQQYRYYGDLIYRKVTWTRYTYTRATLVSEIASHLRNFHVRFTKDKDSITVDQLREYVPSMNSPRPGVKHWDTVKVTWCCIKIIRNGKEVDANLESIIREAEEFNTKPRAKHRRYCYKWCTPWKVQYKCRKQWEIHCDKHIDTYQNPKIVIDNDEW